MNLNIVCHISYGLLKKLVQLSELNLDLGMVANWATMLCVSMPLGYICDFKHPKTQKPKFISTFSL